MPSIISIYPNRIAITPQRIKTLPTGYSYSDVEQSLIDFNVKQLAKKYCSDMLSYTDNFSAPKHPFSISRAGKNKIKDSITALFRLSKPRTIQMQNKKFLYNFRCSFITLTLPSSQVHSDLQIKKECLNQFFVEIRKHYKVNNYLWKAELQQNENIHFHIVTDRYIDYQALRRRWNRIINKLGYLDAYQNKMKSYTLDSYHEMRSGYNKDQTFQNSKQAFSRGQQNGWCNANSVDVKSARSEGEMAHYLAKYMFKKSVDKELSTELLERQSIFGRSWFRSQSLSRLPMSERYLFDDANFIVKEIEVLKNTISVLGDYFRVLYFRFSEVPKYLQKFISSLLIENAKFIGYIFPT